MTNEPEKNPETPEQQNPDGNPEQAEQENEVYTAREIELQKKLAAMTKERDTLKRENERIYRQFVDIEEDKGPEKTLDEWLLEMLNNGGRLPSDYKSPVMKG